ncbi:MAG: acetate--CoA ligase family protein [Nocardioidaceae bacterium]
MSPKPRSVPFALTDATREAVGALLDPGLVVANPLDVWGRGASTETLFTACLEAVAADPGVDAVALAVDLVEEYDGDQSYPLAVAAAAEHTDKPVVVLSTMPAAIDQAQARAARRGHRRARRRPVGLRALGHLRDHADRPPVPFLRAADDMGALPDGWLDAASTLALVARAGVATVPTLSADSRSRAARAAADVGYPLVLGKTDQPGIDHRARVGGVVVGVADEPSLLAAYDDLADRLGPRVALQPMVRGRAELALGVVVDPMVGPLVLVAHGGSRIEELASRAVRAAGPCSPTRCGWSTD